MRKHIEEILKKWLAPFKGNMPSLYLVGGAVRDYFLARTPKDIDLICQDPEAIARRLASVQDAVVVPFLKKADEPCYRVIDRQDKDSFLDLVSMGHHTIDANLKQRDFTLNAIAIQVNAGGILGDIIDPLNGAEDIKRHLIKTTGPDVFVSDPLRIMRAVRFAAEFEFDIEDTTLFVMAKHSFLLEQTASERILSELYKIFSSRRSTFFVKMMDRLGILDVIFPEIIPMKGCRQNSFHHLDVWKHSMSVLENCEEIVNNLEKYFGIVSDRVWDNLKSCSRLPLLKISAMLHDVGKPVSRSSNINTGNITFYDHDKKGSEIAAAISRRLRMSKQDQDFIKTLILEHMHVFDISQLRVRPATRIRWFRKLADDSIPIIILGISDINGTLGPASSEARKNDYLNWSKESVINYYMKIKKQFKRENLIGGKDLIKLGVSPGRKMGSILKKVREAQDLCLIKDRNEALSLAGKLSSIDLSS